MKPETLDNQESEKELTVNPARLSLRKQLTSWRTIVPLVVVIVVFALVAQHLTLELNPKSIGAALARANLWLFLAAFVVYYGSFPLRVLRWRLLLENVGYSKARGVYLPGFFHLCKILYLSWFANVIVPAKLGDMYRAYLLRQEADVSAPRSYGTVLAERILDLVILLLLFISAVLISLHGALPPQLELALQVGLGLVVGLIIGLVALRLYRNQIERLVPQRFRPHYVHFQEGTLGSFKRLHLLAPLTVAIWTFEALRFMLVALAVGLLSGDPLHVFAAALFIALGESLLTTVPLTSGGVGFVEAGMFAMILLFTPHTAAAQNATVAAVLLDRMISLVSVLVFGGILFFVVVVLGKALSKSKQRRGTAGAPVAPEAAPGM
ncbi:MAG TPA: lysylphosphatidylglycerol synthase transmembrane domain-containing protein [Ktedonobacterales bacterium]|nr:lysylphosphatidylglycerol synthase transmembrane domain-containing protein [Ktedonobacterales bacterium]